MFDDVLIFLLLRFKYENVKILQNISEPLMVIDVYTWRFITPRRDVM